MRDEELKDAIRAAMAPYILTPADAPGLQAVTNALHAAGIPLAAGTPVTVEESATVIRLADGRAFRVWTEVQRG